RDTRQVVKKGPDIGCIPSCFSAFVGLTQCILNYWSLCIPPLRLLHVLPKVWHCHP
ncbi:unnamed protein product, partial [Choristocarpus tenellus]